MTVLIVEPDTAARAALYTLLQSRGYHTLEAADGLTAWQLLSSHRDQIRLLVTEATLPGIGGGILIELMRELWPQLPIVVLSAMPGAILARSVPALPQTSFLRKPFRQNDLLAVLESLLPPSRPQA
jgi:CheY-like chemotaxis protein